MIQLLYGFDERPLRQLGDLVVAVVSGSDKLRVCVEQVLRYRTCCVLACFYDGIILQEYYPRCRRCLKKTKGLYIANVYKCNMIVSNTSTLILLAKVDSLSILLDNIKKISIPKIVYEEIANKKDSFEFLTIKKEIEKNRIVLIDVGKKNYSSILAQFKLDEGEAAAYALFKKIKGNAILTDDGELIKLCKIENAPFIAAIDRKSVV